MKTIDDIGKLLDPSELNLPSSPRVVKTIVQEGFDSTGDLSLYIWVLLDDKTSETEQTLDKVRPIEQVIKTVLQEADETRWPYIRFRTESEHRELIDQ